MPPFAEGKSASHTSKFFVRLINVEDAEEPELGLEQLVIWVVGI